MTCANENQFGSPRTTSLRSSASVSKKTKKRQKKVNVEELWLQYLLNVVTITPYIAELLYTL